MFDGGGDLLADGQQRQVHPGHQDQGFQTGDGIARAVAVNGGQRAIMTGVHGLEHIQRFAGTAFADHQAVRAHTQRAFDQIANFQAAFGLAAGMGGAVSRRTT